MASKVTTSAFIGGEGLFLFSNLSFIFFEGQMREGLVRRLDDLYANNPIEEK